MKQNIHLYTICWNEEERLDFFFMHYDTIVTHYHFFDDGSNDNTLKILKSHPRVTIHKFQTIENSYVLSAQILHNQFWKKSKTYADWVIITPIDELIYHKNLTDYLEKCTNDKITAIPAIGFQMISETFPESTRSLVSQIKTGAPWNQMNKLSIFNPGEIDETNYKLGRHEAHPTGNIKYPQKDEILNLHYKYLSFEKTLVRHRELNNKIRAYDKERMWGHRYQWDRNKLLEDWNFFKSKAMENVLEIEITDSYLKLIGIDRWWRRNNNLNEDMS